jgi:hypothetical protein
MAKETENKLEELFDKLLNDGDASALLAEWDNLNRLEQYLVCIITKSNIERMGPPLNRLEVLLQALYNKKA